MIIAMYDRLTTRQVHRGRLLTVQVLSFTSPGFCDELIEVFVARDLRFVGQQLDAGEEIDVRVMEQAEALAMVDDGRIRDAKTIAGLLMWARLPRETVA